MTRSELKELFDLPLGELAAAAAHVTEAHHGQAVIVRGLIEFSNRCGRDCLYCGLRRSQANLRRYRMSIDEIVAAAAAAHERGVRSFVFQSGECADDAPFLLDLVRACRTRFGAGTALTVSCGMMTRTEYERLAAAGADRYLLRFETSDPVLYGRLKRGETLARRLEALEDIRRAGLELGSGFMTGLPGETKDTLIDNVLLATALAMDMGGVGPFIPHPGTPLAAFPASSLEHSLRATALLRLCLPRTHLAATTAAGSIDPNGREKMIACGADVVMLSLTPVHLKKHYQLYPGKIWLENDGLACLGCLSARIRSVGRTPAFIRGDTLYKRKGSHENAAC